MKTERHDSRLRHILVAVAVTVLATLALSATSALAKTVLDYDANRTENPLADNITRLNVNKLERGSHDRVAGAHMCIIEKETGRTVTEWVSDGSTHQVARNTGNGASLDIDKVYVLRELEAPEGYAKAADTEFVLHSDDEFNTTGEILAGPDAEFDMVRGSGDMQAFVINLYDEATVEVEDVEYRRREGAAGDEEEAGVSGDVQKGKVARGNLMQTGDDVATLIVAAAAAANLVVAVRHARRRYRA